MPFDAISCPNTFPGLEYQPCDDEFTKVVMTHHAKLCPSPDEQQAVAALVSKIVECLDKLSLTPDKFAEGVSLSFVLAS